MRLIFASTTKFMIALIMNCVLLVRQGLAWGVLVPTMWGFNAR